VTGLATLPALVQYPLALLLTIGAEWAVYCVIERRAPLSLLLAAILINACTQPVATWLVLYRAWDFLAVEALVGLAEVPLLMALLRRGPRHALALSLAANGTSALLGLVLFR
jgi:hypothetical protein